MVEYICEFLKMNDVEYKENQSLSKISPIRIGGAASVVAYPASTYQYMQILRFLGKINFSYKILGRMTNVLPSDEGFLGIIIKTDRMNALTHSKNKMTAFAGVSLPQIATRAAALGLSGAEELSGIPGSIGGSICGNAGAFGREIADLISSVTVYDPVLDSVYSLGKEELGFSFRDSVFSKRPLIIISADLIFTDADPTVVAGRISEIRAIRQNTQPIGELSLGSTFKRPSGDFSASYMIDQCGLKGRSLGGAAVSLKHAGFIINKNNSTADDYLSLAKEVEDIVYQKFGVRLEKEIKVL